MGLNEILTRRKPITRNPNDDIKVLRSLIEWEPDGKTMKYLIYEIEMTDPKGNTSRFFKVIKLIRVLKLPKNMKQTSSFAQIHTQIMTGIWENSMNFITVMCNMIEPALGQLFLYGVQAVNEDYGIAKTQTDRSYAALVTMLQGSYKTMEHRPINFEEAEWLREKMFSMKHLSVIKGIPKIKDSNPMAAQPKSKSGSSAQPLEIQGTSEEFILGMSDKEYVVLVMATPVSQRTIQNWLTKVAKEMTVWNSQKSGTKALQASVNLPFMSLAGVGSNQGWSNSVSDGHSYTHSSQLSHGESFTESVGKSDGLTEAHGVSHQTSVGEGQSLGHSDGSGKTVTDGTNESSTYSVSDGINTSKAHGHNIGDSVGTSDTHSKTTNVSSSDGISRAEGATKTHSEGHTAGVTNGTTVGTSEGSSHSKGTSKTTSGSLGFSSPLIPVSGNVSRSVGSSETDTTSSSVNQSASESVSKSLSNSESTSESNTNSFSNTKTQGNSMGDSTGTTATKSVGESWTDSIGESHTRSQGVSLGKTSTVAQSQTSSDSYTKTINTTEGVGENSTLGKNTSISQSTSKGQSVTKSDGQSEGRNYGTSQGSTGGLSQILSSSMGVGFSLGASKSFQWEDQEVVNIVELLKYLNQRLMTATNGNGMFYTDMYIATPDAETKSAANAVAKSAWHNGSALVNPMTIIDLPPEEESHLLYHFQAFSPDSTIEGTPGEMGSYKYTTLLLPEEQAAYTHPPRVNEGGISADVQDIPLLSVPSNKKGEIYIGKVISAERWTSKWGYETPYRYCLPIGERMHGISTAESQSGKTTMMTRFAAELANSIIPETKKRMRIFAMDAKKDWRILLKFVDPERAKFYSLGNPDLLPISLNVWKIPKNVTPQHWITGMVEIFCRQYGLGEKMKAEFTETVYDLYESDAKVFVENWRDVAHVRSKYVTFTKIYQRIKYRKDMLDADRNASRDLKETIAKLLERLLPFSRPFTIESKMFGQESGIGIDELIGDDDVTILESYGLETTFKNFIFGAITSGFFKIAQSYEYGFKSEDQYETMLFIEEANEVLTGQDANGGEQQTLKGQSEFEKIMDQSAGLGLYIFSITQKIASMPSSVIANSGIVFTGKISRKEDVEVVIRKIGREERYEDRDLVKWFPRSPVGWFVCRSSKNYDIKDSEPVLVKVEPLSVKAPTNDELVHLAVMKEALKRNKK